MDDPDYLRDALKGELNKAPGCMELFAQMRVGAMPLDDASLEWSHELSPLRRLGRIDMPLQDIAAEGRDEACENLSFNPDNAPASLRRSAASIECAQNFTRRAPAIVLATTAQPRWTLKKPGIIFDPQKTVI